MFRKKKVKAGTEIRMRDGILMVHIPRGNVKMIFTNIQEIVAVTLL